MVGMTEERAYQFYIETDVSNYIGEWVAVAEDKILAHGKNLKEVVRKAKEISGGSKFIIARVPSQETMIF